MKALLKIFLAIFVISMVTACCDRRCGVHKKESPQPEPATIQEKLIKIKKEAGGKGSK